MATRLFGRQTATGGEARGGDGAGGGGAEGQDDGNRREKVKELFGMARKTLGLSPIDKHDVNRFMKAEHGGLSIEEAKVAAVKEFVEMEMRMKPETVETVMREVERIFEPKKDEWNTLYVQFSSEAAAEEVLRHTTYMKKGKAAGRVQHYVPRALYARYRALEKRAAEMRQESNKSISTRVTFQEQDFKLLWRPKNQKPGWNVEPHPEGLPGFQLDTMSGTLPSPSRTPTKGRERYREEESREEGAGRAGQEDGANKKRPHSPTDQGAAKRNKEVLQDRELEQSKEQEREQEQGRDQRRNYR